MSEDTITHLAITFQKDYAGTGKNICSIYINSIPNVTFEFGANSLFGSGMLRLGQGSTDTYLYMMRIYNRALEGTEMQANMLNAIINGGGVRPPDRPREERYYDRHHPVCAGA